MVLRGAGPANKVIQGDRERKNKGPLPDEVGGLVLERRDHRDKMPQDARHTVERCGGSSEESTVSSVSAVGEFGRVL